MDPNNQVTITPSKVNWVHVILYYIIAILIAAPFNAGIVSGWYSKLTENYLVSEWAYLPACLGPLTAACILFVLQRKYKKGITFFGNDPLKNCAIAITPLLVFTIFGIEKQPAKKQSFLRLRICRYKPIIRDR